MHCFLPEVSDSIPIRPLALSESIDSNICTHHVHTNLYGGDGPSTCCATLILLALVWREALGEMFGGWWKTLSLCEGGAADIVLYCSLPCS